MPPTVDELERIAKENASKEIRVYNPLSEDFVCEYDGKEVEVKAGEITTLPYFTGKHVIKHLITAVLNSEGRDNVTAQMIASVRSKVEVDL